MKKYLSLFLFFISSCFCGYFKTIHQLSKQIIRNQKLCPKRKLNKQKKLLEVIKTMPLTDDVPNNVIKEVIDSLHECHHFPLLSENIEIVDEAMETFTYKKKIPQFCRTLFIVLRNIENNNYAKGFLYEIECAVKTEKETDQTIVSFEKAFTNPDGLRRRFDLVTQNENGIVCVCECKNINWQRLASHSKKLKTQLFEQKQIIDSQAIQTLYRFYSKHPIPDKWKRWLIKNNITFVEDNIDYPSEFSISAS